MSKKSKALRLAGEISGLSILARQAHRIKKSFDDLPAQFHRPTSGRNHNLQSALDTVPPLVVMGILLVFVGLAIWAITPTVVGPLLGLVVVLTGGWCWFLAGYFVIGWWQTKYSVQDQPDQKQETEDR